MRKRKKGTELITYILLCISSILFFSWGINLFKKNLAVQAEIRSLKQKLDNSLLKNEKLKKEIEKTERESFWEEKVRERGYQKEGENTVIIQKPSK